MLGRLEGCVALQIVRTIVAGGLLRSVEPILQATALAKQRQQAAALAPIKYAYLNLPMDLQLACSCQSANCK
jgi:hypothetical protein